MRGSYRTAFRALIKAKIAMKAAQACYQYVGDTQRMIDVFVYVPEINEDLLKCIDQAINDDDFAQAMHMMKMAKKRGRYYAGDKDTRERRSGRSDGWYHPGTSTLQ